MAFIYLDQLCCFRTSISAKAEIIGSYFISGPLTRRSRWMEQSADPAQAHADANFAEEPYEDNLWITRRKSLVSVYDMRWCKLVVITKFVIVSIYIYWGYTAPCKKSFSK
ncbi:unnamed protein product [Colias eurytheme]|nr:unnamed protein product [Colias eurytheme]